ncbi:MAG: hypothetical protein COA90_09860 [Gammaproteobacteria bacterium]|nr:MAG: hypothetical protein COA90_09860 [Gammaproteobacteria bacterium]
MNIKKHRIITVLLLLVSPRLYAQQQITLPELEVTAQRKAELLQDVPITLTTFDDASLSITGAQSLKDLDNFTPGLEVISINSTHPKFKMRGIGTIDFGIGTDPSVSIYQDDVYLNRSGGTLLQFTDIKRVEVLKGPQGTLFGRNSAAGVIHIVSQEPKNELEGSLRTRLGNYDKRLIEGMFNSPLIDDRLFLRVNAIYNDRNGVIDSAGDDDAYSDEEYQAARMSLRWLVNNKTDIQYTFDINQVNQQAAASIGLNSSLSPDPDRLYGAVANDVVNGHDDRLFRGHKLKLQHDLSFATMTWISAYQQFSSSLKEDEDGTDKIYAHLDSENEEENQFFSQELRFNGENEHFNWLAGVYFSSEHAKQELKLTTYTNSLNAIAQGSLPNSPSANFPFPDDQLWMESMQNKLRSQSMSTFADLTWFATEKLDLTFGLRYTLDKKEFSWKNNSNTFSSAVPDQLFQIPSYPVAYKNRWIDTDESWSHISPRVVAAYQFNDDVMSFISYTEGYKAGGFNAMQILSSFDPETVDSIEWGVKSTWLDKRLKLNISLFHYDYNDKQDINFEVQGGLGRFVTRTGDAKGKGAEVELSWLIKDNVQLGLNYGYLSAQWQDRTVNSVNYNTGLSQDIDLSGQALLTPKHHAVVNLDYDYSLQSLGNLLIHLDHTYNSRQQFNQTYADYYFDYEHRDSAYHYTNMKVTWQPRGEAWQLALWAENMFDNRYAYSITPMTASILGTPYINSRKPRLFGVEMKVDF